MQISKCYRQCSKTKVHNITYQAFIFIKYGIKRISLNIYAYFADILHLASESISWAGSSKSSIDLSDIALSSGNLIWRSVVQQARIKRSSQWLEALKVGLDQRSYKEYWIEYGFLVNDSLESCLNLRNKESNFSKHSSSIRIGNCSGNGIAISSCCLDIGFQGAFVGVDFESSTVALRGSVCIDLLFWVSI